MQDIESRDACFIMLTTCKDRVGILAPGSFDGEHRQLDELVDDSVNISTAQFENPL